MTERALRWAAALVRATHLIDRAYRRFDRLRSKAVLAWADDRFFDMYNDLSYGKTEVYRPDREAFRTGLFNWEEQAIARYFPPPPARILVGGAGGGREAFALCEKGYEVVAFDPAPVLVGTMHERARRGFRLKTYRASYATLPALDAVGDGTNADIGSIGGFDAAVLGWSSFSHLRSDAARIEALRRFAAITGGPILVSFFSRSASRSKEAPRGAWRDPSRQTWQDPAVMFSVEIGYFRMFSEDEFRELIDRAGLRVLMLDAEASWPHAVVRCKGSEVLQAGQGKVSTIGGDTGEPTRKPKGQAG